MKRSFIFAALLSTIATQAAFAGAPGSITYALIGPADPAGKVPALNAVPGTSDPNIDVPVPVRYLNHGTTYAVEIGSQNAVNFQGTCVTAYILSGKSAGKTTVISTAKTKPYKCGKETVWAWYFITPAIPAYLGTATLTAIEEYNTTKVTLVVPLTIQ